jgi:DNA-binding transcriptional ArsR family regulator
MPTEGGANAVHTVSDVAAAAELFADPSRARIVAALADGRALPASVLADEAGIAPSTCSGHLRKLVDGGALTSVVSGRHRYYSLAGEQVAAALEALSVLAPQRPVRSLRESTRAAAMRRARTCYDHLAGRLGVGVTAALVRERALVRDDGRVGVDRGEDRLAAPVPAHPYRLGPGADEVFARLGVDVASAAQGRRPLLRFCVDWTEQQHHLAGALGAALLTSFERSRWICRESGRRSLTVTDAGHAALAERLDVRL